MKQDKEGKRVVEVRVRTAAVCVAVGVGLMGATVYLARAAPGGATGETLAFSGVLTGQVGLVELSVDFVKGTQVCKAKPKAMNGVPQGQVKVIAGGAFQTELVLDGCPGFFDGGEATYKVYVGGMELKNQDGMTVEAKVAAVPYAKYADQVGVGDCPVEYVRDTTQMGIVSCKRGEDEMVKVGQGRGAFWVDRYEASILDREGKLVTATSADGWPVTASGQWKDLSRPAKAPMVAVSRKGSGEPARNVTWFQAVEACAGSGKELLSRKEWFLAVQGTPDPKMDSAGADGSCVTKAGGPRIPPGGAGVKVTCESVWGVQDMIGSLWEWTDEWYTGAGEPNPTGTEGAYVQHGERSPWPAGPEYGGDLTWNVRARVSNGGIAVNGMPAAALRGGDRNDGPGAGAFALSLTDGPSLWSSNVGFRCAVRR